jgi:hypothetical protein
MEIILGVVIWLALGALHVPIIKYWWTNDFDWTVKESRFTMFCIPLGPAALVVSLIQVAPLMFSTEGRVGDDRVITKCRK